MFFLNLVIAMTIFTASLLWLLKCLISFLYLLNPNKYDELARQGEKKGLKYTSFMVNFSSLLKTNLKRASDFADVELKDELPELMDYFYSKVLAMVTIAVSISLSTGCMLLTISKSLSGGV